MWKGTCAMKYPLLLLIVIAAGTVWLAAARSSTGDRREDFCKKLTLPLESSGASTSLLLSRDSSFGSGLEYSTATFNVTNQSGRPVDTVTVIVEYLDRSDRVVLRVPFYATDKDTEFAAPPFPLPSPQYLEEPIVPGEEKTLVGLSPLISSVCPSKGRVIFEHAWMSDGTEEDFVFLH
jgi:hypothetical protein